MILKLIFLESEAKVGIRYQH